MAKALGDSVVVEAPRVEEKGVQYTVGMRQRIPSKTIAGVIPKFLAEIKSRLGKEKFDSLGKPYFRFYSIDMGKEYDLEVGYLTSFLLDSTPGLVVSNFPAGNYATLKYAGKNRGYQGNKALIEWVKSNNHEMDRWDSERGDTFACRFEVYLSDIAQIPDHKDWIKEVAIKLK